MNSRPSSAACSGGWSPGRPPARPGPGTPGPRPATSQGALRQTGLQLRPRLAGRPVSRSSPPTPPRRCGRAVPPRVVWASTTRHPPLLLGRPRSGRSSGQVPPAVRKQVFLTTKPPRPPTLPPSRGAEDQPSTGLPQAPPDRLRRPFSPPAAPSRPSRPPGSGQCRVIGFTPATRTRRPLRCSRPTTRLGPNLNALHVADPHYLSFEKRVRPWPWTRDRPSRG